MDNINNQTNINNDNNNSLQENINKQGNNDNQEGLLKRISNKIPSILSWGVSTVLFVGVPMFLEARNIAVFQWITRNDGFKREAFEQLGLRPY